MYFHIDCNLQTQKKLKSQKRIEVQSPEGPHIRAAMLEMASLTGYPNYSIKAPIIDISSSRVPENRLPTHLSLLGIFGNRTWQRSVIFQLKDPTKRQTAKRGVDGRMFRSAIILATVSSWLDVRYCGLCRMLVLSALAPKVLSLEPWHLQLVKLEADIRTNRIETRHLNCFDSNSKICSLTKSAESIENSVRREFFADSIEMTSLSITATIHSELHLRKRSLFIPDLFFWPTTSHHTEPNMR